MKLIAWLLLCILCFLMSLTGIGLIIAVPMFVGGTGILLLGAFIDSFR